MSTTPAQGSWIWPDPKTKEEAIRISRRGVWGLGIIGALTLLGGAPPQSLLVGVAFLLLALGIRLGHATAAAAGMLVAVSPIIMLLVNRGPNWSTYLLSGLIQCMMIAYFPFISFRALRMAEQFRDEAGEKRRTSLVPGLVLWIPFSLAVLGFFVFVAGNLYLMPEDVPARGILAGDLVLLEPTDAAAPKEEAARKAELAARARRVVWSFAVKPEELKTGQFAAYSMYTRARWDRLGRRLGE
ncbi:MAG: hypothetical protein ABI972_06395 [Acidobacteriota bacterium]